MATIDRSTDTVKMTCAEYDALLKNSATAPPAPFDYKSYTDDAKKAFDETCNPAFPEVDKSAWTVLQERLLAWQSRTYGVQPYERQVMGITEEFGELDEATTLEKEEDGIADITVFSSQLAAYWRLDLYVLVNAAKARVRYPGELSAIRVVGRGNHVALKALQGIRGMGDPDVARAAIGAFLIDALALVTRQAAGHGKGLYEIVAPIAEVVMQRTKALPQVVE